MNTSRCNIIKSMQIPELRKYNIKKLKITVILCYLHFDLI